MKKLIITAAVLCAAQAAMAQSSEEAVFNSTTELMPYCQKEAADQLGAKGIATYQWSARHHMQGNLMVVEGQIKTDKGEVPVTCRAAKGARERHVSVQVGK